jgi:two-component system, NtrC family, response regulator HydG
VRDAAARRILVVDDDRAFRISIAELLRQDGYEVLDAADATEAGAALQSRAFDLMLLDIRMPGLDGVSFLEVLRTRGEGVPVLMISGFGTVEAIVQTLHLAADDFLTKPVDPDVLSAKVAELLERRPASDGGAERAVTGMVGHAPGMRAVFEAIRQVAPTDSTVLVAGETGTGKELVARAVHQLSPRASDPFVPVNCAALADGLLESELFGHVRGAFTGALRDKQGLFAAAHRGTLFLDEVGDMSLRLQQRLLRALQEREVTPVGAVRPIAVDVRVVAATNRDLRAEVRAGRFRKDLFYRLNVFPIALPPLRERPGDVPLLVEAALNRLRDRLPTGQTVRISPYAIQLMRSYSWPGNVRELFAVVESAGIRAGGTRIEAHHLPPEVRSPNGEASPTADGRYRAGVADEPALIRAALVEVHGVRARAADLLGMSRTTLWRKMREYGLLDG